MAKRVELPYRTGDSAMRKFKVWKTAVCVLGRAVDFLLLGTNQVIWPELVRLYRIHDGHAAARQAI